jgi:hypothetical protein
MSAKHRWAVLLGRRGGKAAAVRRTPAERQALARKAAQARWRKHRETSRTLVQPEAISREEARHLVRRWAAGGKVPVHRLWAAIWRVTHDMQGAYDKLRTIAHLLDVHEAYYRRTAWHWRFPWSSPVRYIMWARWAWGRPWRDYLRPQDLRSRGVREVRLLAHTAPERVLPLWKNTILAVPVEERVVLLLCLRGIHRAMREEGREEEEGSHAHSE